MNKSFLLRVLISGLLALFVLCCTSALGVWQYSQSQRDDIQKEVLGASPVALEVIHAPEAFVQERAFARPVQLQGKLDCTKSLQLTSETFAGTLCVFNNMNDRPIVVLFNEDVSIDVGATTLSLIGRLQPAQSYEPVRFNVLKDTSLSEINIHALVYFYQENLYDGFVVVESIEGENEQQVFSVDEGLLILPPAGIEFRNLFYAWQWWIFAGFTLLLWAKYVRDEWRKHQLAM